jgi:hypothetical protein
MSGTLFNRLQPSGSHVYRLLKYYWFLHFTSEHFHNYVPYAINILMTLTLYGRNVIVLYKDSVRTAQ